MVVAMMMMNHKNNSHNNSHNSNDNNDAQVVRKRIGHEKDPLLLVPETQFSLFQSKAKLLDEKNSNESVNTLTQDAFNSSIHADPLTSSKEKATYFKAWTTSKRFYWTCVVTFILLGLSTRLYSISEGNKVIWDEAHFGKFGSYYLNRTFYFDVHPPLGKMLVGLAGYISGYNGSFEFPSGQSYPSHVNYIGMRTFLALFGAFSVPLSYMTAIELGLSQEASLLVGLAMSFDNGLVGISRLILLDSMLLFFTVLTAYFLASFNSCRERPFTLKWYLSLAGSGFAIGCASSVKWVGLFVTALVGIQAILDLWNLLGDASLPKRFFVRHFAARFVFLINLPVLIYLFTFYLHFIILNRSGPGDATMSSLFQAGLVGNSISHSPIDVAFGSQVTIRNAGYGGGILHSHVQTYPEGSHQQQVTCYHHRDSNNDFMIKLMHFDGSPESLTYHKNETIGIGLPTSLRIVKDGDIIRLVHVNTGKNLHSHPIPASVTKTDFEVSGYANDTMYVDPNDHWIVELAHDKMGIKIDRRLQSLSSEFRLKHKSTGCYLVSSKASYPEWGFKQTEVSCEKVFPNGPAPTGRHALWNIESNQNEQLPPGDPSLYKSSFFDSFIECNVNMWRTNNALVKDAELEPGILVSYPWQWPFLSVGIRLASWDDEAKKFYMLGNPFIWWTSIAAIILLTLGLGSLLLVWKRGIVPSSNPTISKCLQQSIIALAGWGLHHIPFYIMGRVLYLHHYYPTLFFAILALGIVFDHLVILASLFQTRWNNPNVFKSGVFITLTVGILGTFYLFAPICYGMTGPASNYSYLNWISTWNIA